MPSDDDSSDDESAVPSSLLPREVRLPGSQKAVLDAIGDQAKYIGPIGAGSVAKLVHNAAGYTIQAALAALVRDDIVSRDGRRYVVVDSLLREWIARRTF